MTEQEKITKMNQALNHWAFNRPKVKARKLRKLQLKLQTILNERTQK